MRYEQELRNARSYGEIFDMVKRIVFDYCGRDQAGLMLGLSDLGGNSEQYVGAFYLLHGNMIIINKRPIQRILQTNPSLYNPYIFHVLLHEYIHSLGIMDETMCRQLTYDISYKYFGGNHIITQLAQNITKFMPHLTYAPDNFLAPKDMNIEFISGFDRSNTNYIM